MGCSAVAAFLCCAVSLHFEAISMDHAERIDELEARLRHEVATRERLEKELQENESRFRIAIQATRESKDPEVIHHFIDFSSSKEQMESQGLSAPWCLTSPCASRRRRRLKEPMPS